MCEEKVTHREADLRPFVQRDSGTLRVQALERLR